MYECNKKNVSIPLVSELAAVRDLSPETARYRYILLVAFIHSCYLRFEQLFVQYMLSHTHTHMCSLSRTHTHTHVLTHTHTNTCAFTHTHGQTHTCAFTHTRTHTHTHTHMLSHHIHMQKFKTFTPQFACPEFLHMYLL